VKSLFIFGEGEHLVYSLLICIMILGVKRDEKNNCLFVALVIFVAIMILIYIYVPLFH